MFERFTDRARRAITLTQDEARRLHHDYVGPEHLLLGLIREAEGIAAQVLVRLGVDLRTAREQVLQLLADPGDLRGDREWTPPRLRPARDRVLAVVEPLWRPLYRKTTPRTRAVITAGLPLGLSVLVRMRGAARQRK